MAPAIADKFKERLIIINEFSKHARSFTHVELFEMLNQIINQLSKYGQTFTHIDLYEMFNEIIDGFSGHNRCLTIMQLYKMLNEEVDIIIIEMIVEFLNEKGMISQCGLTKCIWTQHMVKTYIAKEAD